MARRSIPCPACRRLLTVEVAANQMCVIPAHGHKKQPCQASEQVAMYRDQPTAAQARTQARELIERERAGRLPGYAGQPVPADAVPAEINLEQKALDAAFARE